MPAEKKYKEKKEECPHCKVSDQTLEILKREGRKKEKTQKKNGESSH